MRSQPEAGRFVRVPQVALVSSLPSPFSNCASHEARIAEKQEQQTVKQQQRDQFVYDIVQYNDCQMTNTFKIFMMIVVVMTHAHPPEEGTDHPMINAQQQQQQQQQ